MSAKIKLRQINSLQGIMASCLKVVDQQHIFSDRYEEHNRIKDASGRDKAPNIAYKTLNKIKISKQRNTKIATSSQLQKLGPIDINYDLAKSRKKYQHNFCGDVMCSKVNKPTFKNVVLKYKRNYHPINASKGSRDTSNQRVREPKKVRMFNQQMEEDWNQDGQMKRMAILSQVIAENAKKGMKLFRQRSHKRHKTVF